MSFPIILVGYEVTPSSIQSYLETQSFPSSGLPSIKHLLRHLEAQLGVNLSLARLGGTSSPRTFICCYADYIENNTKVYDCEEVMQVGLPVGFERLQELIETVGGVKRVFAPYGALYSYDRDGKARF